ncbi:hypothetical protein GCM10028807_07870 [Spirosoma daeguense]
MSSTTTQSRKGHRKDWQWPTLLLLLFFSIVNNSFAQTQVVSFSFTGSIETWTVPAGVTSLTIEARGGEGGAVVGQQIISGRGAILATQVSVSPGQALSVLVGQNINGKSAGGGGSFVVTNIANTITPLIVAGGGGGASQFGQESAAKHGQLVTTGGTVPAGGLGGQDTQGGNGGNNGKVGGGGGLLGNGGGSTAYPNAGGRSFVNGGAGGSAFNGGSFGGGGSGSSDADAGGGGGGGYSGGGGGGGGVGGGGGSFTAGTRLFARTGATEGNSGNGLVVITYVVQPPTITNFAASPNPACAGDLVSFSATIGNVSGSYSYTMTEITSTASYTGTSTVNGDITLFNLLYDSPGPRNFVLRVVSNGQETTSGNLPVTINPNPVATLSNDGPITCIKPTVTLTASGGSSYTFNSSSGTIGTPGSASTVEVSTPGTYTVRVANPSGCVSSTTTTVGSTAATVTANLTNDGPLSCTKATVNLMASGGSTYQFSAGATQVGGNSTSAVATVNQAGVYSVTVLDGNGCSGTASTTVGQDNTQPTVSISANPSLTIAQGQSTTLTASGANTYVWSDGTSTNVIVVNIPGTYSVTGTTGTCQGVASVTVVAAGAFAITAVTTNNCQQIAANRYVISFTPQYRASNGQPISFSVVNEIFPTTNPGPYTLQLYTDNPVIVLKATQPGNPGEASSSYNWLMACSNPMPNTPPRVNQPLTNQIAKVGEAFGYNIPQTTFTDNETPQSLVLSVSGLPAGMNFTPPNQIGGVPSQTGVSQVTVTATDPQGLSVSTTFSLSVIAPSAGNTTPTVANPVANQTATQGQPFSLNVSATFTDAQTPNALTLTSSPLPLGLTLSSGVISGTPSQTGTTNVTLTATDSGGLSASTNFSLTVQPAPIGGNFVITGVTTNNCQQIASNRYAITFTPIYSGTTGAPISFSVVNELFPTTDAGPYSLQLYNDNPTIVLKAQQSGTPGEVSYPYNWLAACSNPMPNTPPRVNQPLSNQTARVGQEFGYTIPQLTFTDNETPTTLTLSVSGLPAGLNFSPPTQIGGVPSVSGVSTVTVTATDPQGLTVSTTFMLTVVSASTPVGFAITGVQTISCLSTSANQRSVTFQPQYSGSNGSPISFSVVNEMLPTTNPGPYTLQLYTDNPTLQLRAQQGGSQAGFAYNWLAACNSPARQGATDEQVVTLAVRVLGNPVVGESVEIEIRGAVGQSLQLQLTSANGKLLSQRLVERAGDVERQRMSLGQQPAGLLLLQVSTPNQSRIIKVIKVD